MFGIPTHEREALLLPRPVNWFYDTQSSDPGKEREPIWRKGEPSLGLPWGLNNGILTNSQGTDRISRISQEHLKKCPKALGLSSNPAASPRFRSSSFRVKRLSVITKGGAQCTCGGRKKPILSLSCDFLGTGTRSAASDFGRREALRVWGSILLVSKLKGTEE